MKVIIAGSRTIRDISLIEQAVAESGFEVHEIVSGTAQGVDRLGEQYGRSRSLRISRFPAHWGKYGKAAGAIRNKQMAKYADALIAIWDGKSKGTDHMIRYATQIGLPRYVKVVGESPSGMASHSD